MKRLLSFVALAAVLAPAGVPIRVRAQERGDVQLNASEVLLDLVVTDKKGHPIVDLKRDEVEVLENGERQDVTSFGLVRVGPQQKSASESAAPVADEPLALARSPFNGVNLILIVVDRTSVTQQNLAQVYKQPRRSSTTGLPSTTSSPFSSRRAARCCCRTSPATRRACSTR